MQITPTSASLNDALLPHLAGTRAARSLHAYDEVASTMDLAAELAKSDAPDGTLVWTSRQTDGRGRQGRTWVSPAGGIYLSLVVRPKRPQDEIPQLALVAGLAVAETIRQEAKLLPAVRWPNDVLLAGKKVCGILVESKHGAAIVGIGVNVTTDPKNLPEVGTSLSAQRAAQTDPMALTGALCRSFDRWYDAWVREGFAPVREALRPLMALFGQVVHITAGNTRFEGTATDLDERGRLVVRLDSGVHRAFEMGEVSLLG